MEPLSGKSRPPLDCLITENRPEVGLQRGIDLSTMSNGSTNSVNVRRFLRLLFNFGRGRLLWKGTVASLSTNRSRRTHVLMSFSTESEQEPQNLLTFQVIYHQSSVISSRCPPCRTGGSREGGDTGDFDEQADKGSEGSQDDQGIVERDASRKEAPAVK